MIFTLKIYTLRLVELFLLAGNSVLNWQNYDFYSIGIDGDAYILPIFVPQQCVGLTLCLVLGNKLNYP